jgi:hypothetical protein
MSKVKIPKRVGGVKVPKKVRKQAKKALKLTESRAVRDLALAGLTLAAEAMLDRGRATAAAPGERRAGLNGLDLGEVVHAAVAEGARRFLQGFEEGVAAASPAAPAKAPAKKPAAPRPKRSPSTRKAPAKAP